MAIPFNNPATMCAAIIMTTRHEDPSVISRLKTNYSNICMDNIFQSIRIF